MTACNKPNNANQCQKACTYQKKEATTTKIEEQHNYVWRRTNFLKEDNDPYTQKESCNAKQGYKFVGKTSRCKTRKYNKKKSCKHKDRSLRKNYFWKGTNLP